MSNENINLASQLSTLLLMAFIILKLTDVISWSWWWVTSPLWGAVALGIAAGLITGLIKAFKD